MNKAIYKLKFDCGRGGNLDGIFVAEKEKVATLISSRQEIAFGECLGKHSWVQGPLDESDIELVTDDPKVIEVFEKFNLWSGYDPFDYLV